jgi:hypothetical protein
METVISDAIKSLAQKAATSTSHEALHYSQAALNLMHVLQVKQHIAMSTPPTATSA